jgi:hypothetical protein
MLPVAVSSQVVASLQVVALSPEADWLLAAVRLVELCRAAMVSPEGAS